MDSSTRPLAAWCPIARAFSTSGMAVRQRHMEILDMPRMSAISFARYPMVARRAMVAIFSGVQPEGRPPLGRAGLLADRLAGMA